MNKIDTSLVLYLEKSKLSFYVGLTGQTFSVDLPPEIMSDMELKDSLKLKKLLKNVIESQELSPTTVIIVLAPSVYFTFELSEDPAESIEDQLESHKAQIPFTSPFVKDIKLDTNKRLAIGLNRDMYEPLITFLNSFSFDVTTLVPAHVVPGAIAESGLTPAVGRDIISAYNKLEQSDFLEPSIRRKKIITSRNDQEPSQRNRVFVLAGVFLLLILILGYFVWRMMNENASLNAPKLSVQTELPQVVSEQEELQEMTEESSSSLSAELNEIVPDQLSTSEAQLLRDSLTVKILNGSGESGQANAIRDVFLSRGYSKISTGNAGTIKTSTTIITVSKEVPPILRTEIEEIISDFSASITLKEVANGAEDILITTAPSSQE